jgi:transposase
MLDTLREHLLEKPGLYLDELVVFIHNEFNVLVTESTISRALKSIGWSKKKTR